MIYFKHDGTSVSLKTKYVVFDIKKQLKSQLILELSYPFYIQTYLHNHFNYSQQIMTADQLEYIRSSKQ